ncbi:MULTISPECIES: SRPBCC family protein [Rhizobium]|uniref:SRPBCC family protein n=1 Tax=Rhizobium rhododendri TaxID=2506430 RepID=A0ABY8IMV3_9HYPH|nr:MULTISPECIES: SRPBCC family protein [Rhizobium]MBZ5758232.1 SRPBCC family protein [Rhizobium sp. VS19-DR96]MBZ5764938.1 SRPBCC family protein [Rhizobium sp. VS19-DR129.2]MBZ5772481.1 SRPBCC family protein [Rhizobium sp. VS19-DRK62.2]MBZ5782832.1 SRPBCC family protein [Rhizobium sp. VS19-DR121]MBZ5800280.1 SRPBCC family protein [Rhizobium sp. VS19-DR181]
MSTMTAEIVHITIRRDWREVYDFASKPENMPLWASGLATAFVPDGADWIAAGALGTVRIAFAPPNDFGVIDHTVTEPSGRQFYNALRVVRNGDGCEMMFTLLRVEGMTDAQFEADANHVARDLATLKGLMESEAL